MAAVGDIRRFPSRGSWSATSASIPACASPATGRPATAGSPRQGSAEARHVLGEAAWNAVRDPRAAARVLSSASARAAAADRDVATARKLAVLFWCLLTREQDYAFGRPSLTRNEDPPARARRRRPAQQGPATASRRAQAKPSATPSATSPARPRPPTDDWSPTGKPAGPTKAGAGATPGRASQRPSKGKAARQTPRSPNVCASLRQSPAPNLTLAQEPQPSRHLTFIRRPKRECARASRSGLVTRMQKCTDRCRSCWRVSARAWCQAGLPAARSPRSPACGSKRIRC